MNKIPFNLEAFKNGAIALNGDDTEVKYVKEINLSEFEVATYHLDRHYDQTLEYMTHYWSMKPTPLDDWITVVNGKYPIDIPEGCGQKLLIGGIIIDLCGSYIKGSPCTLATVAVRLKKKTPKIENKGIQTITEKELKELQEILLPKRKPSPPPITEIGQNETSRIAGEAILGFKKGNVVKCDIIGRLMK